MSRIAYVNGAYLPHAHAKVHVEDRGYQFADGIYEYIAFYNGIPLDFDLHISRLRRSLAEMHIDFTMQDKALRFIVDELIARNRRVHGGIYMQITRGVAKRDHPFPHHIKPALVLTICGAKTPKPHEIEHGVSVITQPDIRWGRCHIKSVALLANVLAKQEASKAKAREAWLIRDDGTVTEGAVSNAYIITEQEGIVTHPANERILSGITRDVALKLARDNGMAVSERPFNIAELSNAREAFLTSTSANILPVVKVGDHIIGNGKPGPVTQKLLGLYLAHVKAQTQHQL